MANKFLSILSDKVTIRSNKILIDTTNLDLKGDTNYLLNISNDNILSPYGQFDNIEPYQIKTAEKTFFGFVIDFTKYDTANDLLTYINTLPQALSIKTPTVYNNFKGNYKLVKGFDFSFTLLGLKSITLETIHNSVTNNMLQHTHYFIIISWGGGSGNPTNATNVLLTDYAGYMMSFNTPSTIKYDNAYEKYTFPDASYIIENQNNRSKTDLCSITLNSNDVVDSYMNTNNYTAYIRVLDNGGEYYNSNGAFSKLIVEYDIPYEEFKSRNRSFIFILGNTNITNCNIVDTAVTNLDVNNYEVYINNVKTDQKINAITATAGNIIEIKALNDTIYFPKLNLTKTTSDIYYVSPFPLMTLDFETDIKNYDTALAYYYARLRNKNIYINNPQLESISYRNRALPIIQLSRYNQDIGLLALMDLLKELPNLKSVANLFNMGSDPSYSYPGTLPEDLFKYNTKLTDFSDCFRQTGLTTIPENLFKFNTEADNFYRTFHSCLKLTSIPENLFKFNTEITKFDETFYGCQSLTSIPENLFKFNTKITKFDWAFSGCRNVTGKLPELWITHPTASHLKCFDGCTKADNYADAQAAGWA